MSAITKSTANPRSTSDEAPYDMFQSLRQSRRKATASKRKAPLPDKDESDIAPISEQQVEKI